MSSQPQQQISALTGLRFFAAAVVVVFHFAAPYHFTNFIKHGAFGVTVFFVLSGFILSYSYSTGPGSIRGHLRSFWAARFARLYPVYLLGMALFLPIVLNDMSEPIWKRGASLVLSLTAMQAWFHSLGLSWGMWNPPGWSLSAEAFFYLVFPFACVMLSKLSARQLIACALGFWIASVLGLFFPTILPFAGDDFREFVPLVRLPEFLLGVVAGLLWKNRQSAAFDKLSSHVALASAVILLALMGSPLDAKWFFSGVFAPLAALLICSLACGRGMLAAVLSWRPIVVLGGASYSLYILHWPAWQIAEHFFGKSVLAVQQPYVYFLGYFLATVAASWLCFRFVEEPLNQRLRSKLMTSSRAPRHTARTVAQSEMPSSAMTFDERHPG